MWLVVFNLKYCITLIFETYFNRFKTMAIHDSDSFHLGIMYYHRIHDVIRKIKYCNKNNAQIINRPT